MSTKEAWERTFSEYDNTELILRVYIWIIRPGDAILYPDYDLIVESLTNVIETRLTA